MTGGREPYRRQASRRTEDCAAAGWDSSDTRAPSTLAATPARHSRDRPAAAQGLAGIAAIHARRRRWQQRPRATAETARPPHRDCAAAGRELLRWVRRRLERLARARAR